MNAPCLLLASGRGIEDGRGGGGGGAVDGFDTGDVAGEDCGEGTGEDVPEAAGTGVEGVDRLTPFIEGGRTDFTGTPLFLFDSATVAPVS